MKSARLVPFWAWQFAVGIAVVLVAVAMFATLVGAAMRVPSNFLDEVGRTVSRVVPQEASDIPSDGDLRKVIDAMPHGKLRVATIDTEHDRVVFTITADRAAVKARSRPATSCASPATAVSRSPRRASRESSTR